MRYGSVCSGIEAATVAWHSLGWTPQWFSEIEAFPSSVLAHHYPDVPNLGDMTQFEEWSDDPIDLLVGGTPCQSFSVAGLRKGLDDPRGNLMLTFGAIAAKYRPEWVVWENVPGVLSSNKGRDFGAFLRMLGELGYGFAYRVLDAQFFGVPQRRRRVFVVGCLGGWRAAAAVLFERHSLSGHPAPCREKGERATPLLEVGARTGSSTTDPKAGVGIGSQADPMFTLQAGKQHGVVARMRGFGDYELDDLAGTLKSRDAKDAKDAKDATDLVTCVHGTQDPCVSNQAHSLGRNNGQENALFVSLRGREGGATAELGGPIAGTLRAATGGGDKPHVMAATGDVSHTLRGEGFDASEDGTGRGVPVVGWSEELTAQKELAGTITRGGSGGRHDGVMQKDMAVRRLTPVECERLQGFPDGYTDVAWYQCCGDRFHYDLGRYGCPNCEGDSVARLKTAAGGPRYKALGNSMAVPVMRWIGERIQQVAKIMEAA